MSRAGYLPPSPDLRVEVRRRRPAAEHSWQLRASSSGEGTLLQALADILFELLDVEGKGEAIQCPHPSNASQHIPNVDLISSD